MYTLMSWTKRVADKGSTEKTIRKEREEEEEERERNGGRKEEGEGETG